AIPTFTVDAQGRLTAASTAAVIAPAGTLTGTTLASGVTTSSLTSVGTLSALTVSGQTSLGNASTTAFSSSYASSTNAFFGHLSVGALSGFLGANNGALYQIASSSLDLPNSALQNSSITINGTAFNLGDSHTITAASSTLLSDSNTFSGTNTFSSTITGSITGNAGTATALQ